jgi:hypothetical protein
MNIYSEATRVKALQSKGGVMFFAIEKLDKLYRGMVLLLPVQNHYRKRIVCMKVYRAKEEGKNETYLS